ncbi:DUF2254 domain-containing protein [Hwanghaeella sp.]|uniref:DUF2254 domain-containing protein n=1 Tax=Hwanghaeella sp. TaxID=2605943 RepID=UPI003CCBDCBE
MSAPMTIGRLTVTRLYNSFMALQANLWLIPALYCATFFLMTAGLYIAEMAYPKVLHGPVTLFQGETADAKSVVATLLSAMITMATLAISITIVVLSLAASQLGPRLIKSVMSDRRTKDFIGMFFGAIVACFVLTVILHSRQPEQPVPQTTIAFVFLLVFVNLFVLLGFVHHIARSCIADSVINRVSRELTQSIERLAEDDGKKGDAEKDAGQGDGRGASADLPDGFEDTGVPLVLPKSGYVQQIDHKAVVQLAADADAVVRVDVSPGYFGVDGEAVGWIHGAGGDDAAEELARAITDAFTIGSTRTPTQDLEYSIRHLVEIATRALSPGINDSFTAIQVIDQLSAALACLFRKTVPDAKHVDKDGTLRLYAATPDPSEIVFNAFDRIRHSGCGKPDVSRHMLAKLRVLAGFAQSPRVKAALNDQVEAIEQDIACCQAALIDEGEIRALAAETKKILRGEGAE